MNIDLFDYQLPEELIALHPPESRDGGKLMVLYGNEGACEHRNVTELAELLPRDCLLVLNETRVIPARLRAHRPTGGAVEVLLVRMLDSDEGSCKWTALTRANKALKSGDCIDLCGIKSTVIERHGRGDTTLLVEASSQVFSEHLKSHGEVPLPPYIKRAPVPEDLERYQTVFAKNDGSVAAPTASLHFTDEMLCHLKDRGIQIAKVTLHVGPGTFRPISADSTDDHEMDAEQFTIPAKTVKAINSAKADGQSVIAVGTTVTRALEGAFDINGKLEEGQGFTNLFITPGFEFKVVDGLVTNFHLPRSTLLCLVSALAGRQRMLTAYEQAVKARYRFYSYGDAMLILPGQTKVKK